MTSNNQRRQVEIPDILYHITHMRNIHNITKYGLVPHKTKGACGKDELNCKDRFGVYLTSDYETIIMIDSDFGTMKSQLVVIEVSVIGIKDRLTPDEAYDFDRDMFSDEDLEEGLYDQFSWIYKGIIEKERILKYYSYL